MIINYLNNKYNNLKIKANRQIRHAKEMYRHYFDNPSVGVLQSTSRTRGVYIVKYYQTKRKLFEFWDKNKVLLTPSGFFKQSVVVTKKTFNFFYKKMFPELYAYRHPHSVSPDPATIKWREQQQKKSDLIKLSLETSKAYHLELNLYKANPLLPLKLNSSTNRRYTKKDFVDYYNNESITTTPIALHSLSTASKDVVKIDKRLKILSGDAEKRQLQLNSLRSKLNKHHGTLTEKYKQEFLLFKSRLKYIEDQQKQTSIGPLLIKYENCDAEQINDDLRNLVGIKLLSVAAMARDESLKTTSMKNLNDMQNLIEISTTNKMREDLNTVGLTYNVRRFQRLQHLLLRLKNEDRPYAEQTFLHYMDSSNKIRFSENENMAQFCLRMGRTQSAGVRELKGSADRVNRFIDSIHKTIDTSFTDYRNSIFNFEKEKQKLKICENKITNLIEEIKTTAYSKNEIKDLLIDESGVINHIIETEYQKLDDITFLENLKFAQLGRKKQFIKDDFNKFHKEYDKLIKKVVKLHNNQFPNNDQLLAAANPDELNLDPDTDLLNVENDFAVQVPGLILPDDYDEAIANRPENRQVRVVEINDNNFVSSIRSGFNSITSAIGSVINKFKGIKNEIPSDTETEIEIEPVPVEEEEIIHNDDVNIYNDNIEIDENDENILFHRGELTENMQRFIEKILREKYNLTELESFCNELKRKIPRIKLDNFTEVEDYKCNPKQAALALCRTEEGTLGSKMRIKHTNLSRVNGGMDLLEKLKKNPELMYEYEYTDKQEEFALPIEYSVQKNEKIIKHDEHILKLKNQLAHSYLMKRPQFLPTDDPNHIIDLLPVRADKFGYYVPDIKDAWKEQKFHLNRQRKIIDGIKGRLLGSSLHELAQVKEAYAVSAIRTATGLPVDSFNNFSYNYQDFNSKTLELKEKLKTGEIRLKWDKINGEAQEQSTSNHDALNAKLRTFHFCEFKSLNLDYVELALHHADRKFFKNLKKDQTFDFIPIINECITDGDLTTFIESLTTQNIFPALPENHNIFEFDENIFENTPRPNFYNLDEDYVLELCRRDRNLQILEVVRALQAHPKIKFLEARDPSEPLEVLEVPEPTTEELIWESLLRHDSPSVLLPPVIFLGGPEGPVTFLPFIAEPLDLEDGRGLITFDPVPYPPDIPAPVNWDEVTPPPTTYIRLTSSYEEFLEDKIAEADEARKKNKDKSVDEKTNLLFSNYSNQMKKIVEKDKSNLNEIESLINQKNVINNKLSQYKKEREDIFFRISSQIKSGKPTPTVESEYTVKPTIENIFAKLIGATQLPKNMDATHDIRPQTITDVYEEYNSELKGILPADVAPKILPINLNLSHLFHTSMELETAKARLELKRKVLAKQNLLQKLKLEKEQQKLKSEKEQSIKLRLLKSMSQSDPKFSSMFKKPTLIISHEPGEKTVEISPPDTKSESKSESGESLFLSLFLSKKPVDKILLQRLIKRFTLLSVDLSNELKISRTDDVAIRNQKDLMERTIRSFTTLPDHYKLKIIKKLLTEDKTLLLSQHARFVLILKLLENKHLSYKDILNQYNEFTFGEKTALIENLIRFNRYFIDPQLLEINHNDKGISNLLKHKTLLIVKKTIKGLKIEDTETKKPHIEKPVTYIEIKKTDKGLDLSKITSNIEIEKINKLIQTGKSEEIINESRFNYIKAQSYKTYNSLLFSDPQSKIPTLTEIILYIKSALSFIRTAKVDFLKVIDSLKPRPVDIKPNIYNTITLEDILFFPQKNASFALIQQIADLHNQLLAIRQSEAYSEFSEVFKDIVGLVEESTVNLLNEINRFISTLSFGEDKLETIIHFYNVHQQIKNKDRAHTFAFEGAKAMLENMAEEAPEVQRFLNFSLNNYQNNTALHQEIIRANPFPGAVLHFQLEIQKQQTVFIVSAINMIKMSMLEKDELNLNKVFDDLFFYFDFALLEFSDIVAKVGSELINSDFVKVGLEKKVFTLPEVVLKQLCLLENIIKKTINEYLNLENLDQRDQIELVLNKINTLLFKFENLVIKNFVPKKTIKQIFDNLSKDTQLKLKNLINELDLTHKQGEMLVLSFYHMIKLKSYTGEFTPDFFKRFLTFFIEHNEDYYINANANEFVRDYINFVEKNNPRLISEELHSINPLEIIEDWKKKYSLNFNLASWSKHFMGFDFTRGSFELYPIFTPIIEKVITRVKISEMSNNILGLQFNAKFVEQRKFLLDLIKDPFFDRYIDLENICYSIIKLLKYEFYWGINDRNGTLFAWLETKIYERYLNPVSANYINFLNGLFLHAYNTYQQISGNYIYKTLGDFLNYLQSYEYDLDLIFSELVEFFNRKLEQQNLDDQINSKYISDFFDEFFLSFTEVDLHFKNDIVTAFVCDFEENGNTTLLDFFDNIPRVYENVKSSQDERFIILDEINRVIHKIFDKRDLFLNQSFGIWYKVAYDYMVFGLVFNDFPERLELVIDKILKKNSMIMGLADLEHDLRTLLHPLLNKYISLASNNAEEVLEYINFKMFDDFLVSPYNVCRFHSAFNKLMAGLPSHQAVNSLVNDFEDSENNQVDVLLNFVDNFENLLKTDPAYYNEVSSFLREALKFPLMPFDLQFRLIQLYRSNLKRILTENIEDIESWNKNSNELLDKYLIKYFIKMLTGSEINELPQLHPQPKSIDLSPFFIPAESLKTDPYFGSTKTIENKLLNSLKDIYIENYEKIWENIDIFNKRIANILNKISNNMLFNGVKSTFTSTFSFLNMIKRLIISNFFPSLAHKSFDIKSILSFLKKNLSITNLAANLKNNAKKFLSDIKSGFEFVQNLNNPPKRLEQQFKSYTRKIFTPIKFIVKFKDNQRRNMLFDQKPYSEKPIIPYKTLLSHKFKDNYPTHFDLPNKLRIDTKQITFIPPLPANCCSDAVINSYNYYRLSLQFLHFKLKLFDYQTLLKSDSGFLKAQLTRPLFGKPNMFLTENLFVHFRSMLQQKKLNPNRIDLSELKINYFKLFKRLYNFIIGSSLEYEDKYANIVAYFSQLDSQLYQILKIQNLDLFTYNFIKFTSYLVRPAFSKNNYNTLRVDLMNLCNAFKIIDKNPTLKSPLQRVVANIMVTINDGMSYSFEFFGTVGGLTHFTLFTENSYISFIHYLKIKTVPFRQDLIPELKKHAEFTVVRNDDQFYLIEQFLSKMKNPSRYVSLVYLVTGDKTPIQTFTKLSSYKEFQNPAMRHFLQFDFGYLKLSNKPFGKFFIPEMISNVNYKVHFDKSFSTSSKVISTSLGPEYLVGKSQNLIVPDQFQRFDFNFATYMSVRSFLNNSFKTIEKKKQLHLNLNELLFKQLFLFKQNISLYNNKHPFLPSLTNWIMLLRNNNYMSLSANWLKAYRGRELTTKISPSLYEHLDQYNIVATIYAAPNKNLTPQQPVKFNFKANFRFYLCPTDLPSPKMAHYFFTYQNVLKYLNKTSVFYPQNLNYSFKQKFEFSNWFKFYSTVKNKILSRITNFNFLKLKIQNYLLNEIKPSILLIEKAVNNFINKIINGTHEILKCLVNLFNKLLDFLNYLIQLIINFINSVENIFSTFAEKVHTFFMKIKLNLEVEYVDQNSDITNSEEDDRFFGYILYIVRLFYLFVYQAKAIWTFHFNWDLSRKIERKLNPKGIHDFRGCHFDVVPHGTDMYRPYWNSQYSTILMQYLWSKTSHTELKPVVATTTPSEIKFYKKGYFLNMSNYTSLLGTGHANTQYLAFFNLKRVKSQLSELVALLKFSILNLTNSLNKDNFWISESKLLNIAQIALLESNYWNVKIVVWYIQNKTLFCNLVTPSYLKNGKRRMKFRYISGNAPIYNDVENVFFNEIRTRRYADIQSDFDIKTIIFKFKNLDELVLNRFSEFDRFENLKKPLSETKLDKSIKNVETVSLFEHKMPKVVLYNKREKGTKFDVITPSIPGGKRMKIKTIFLDSLGIDWKRFNIGTKFLPSIINTTKHLQPVTTNLVKPLNNVEPLKLESKELKNKKLLENKDKELDSSTKKITTMAELYDAINDFIQNDLFSWIMFHEYREQCIRSQTDLWPGGIFSNITSSLIQGTICAFAIFAAHFCRAPTKRGSAWLASLKALLGFCLCTVLAYAIIHYTGIDILSELLKLTRFIFGFQRVPQKVIVPFQVNATLDSHDSSVFIAPYYSTKKSNHKMVEIFKPVDETEKVETPTKEVEKDSSETILELFDFYNF